MSENSRFVGYCRVSSRDQNLERQIVALKAAGCEIIYQDKASGKDLNRPAYQKMLNELKPGDCVVFSSLDRLSRNYDDTSSQWKLITQEKRCDIKILDMPILDTRREKNLLGTLISDLVLVLLSYVAESEYHSIHQRQAEGIAAAKARGVHFGRMPKPLPDNFQEVYQKWKHKKISVAKAAEECGMPQTTFYQRAKAFEKTKIKNS